MIGRYPKNISCDPTTNIWHFFQLLYGLTRTKRKMETNREKTKKKHNYNINPYCSCEHMIYFFVWCDQTYIHKFLSKCYFYSSTKSLNKLTGNNFLTLQQFPSQCVPPKISFFSPKSLVVFITFKVIAVIAINDNRHLFERRKNNTTTHTHYRTKKAIYLCVEIGIEKIAGRKWVHSIVYFWSPCFMPLSKQILINVLYINCKLFSLCLPSSTNMSA